MLLLTKESTAAAATREEMREARLPIAYRDSCANLLIPLNKCRRETWYAPWKCSVCTLSDSTRAARAVVTADPDPSVLR